MSSTNQLGLGAGTLMSAPSGSPNFGSKQPRSASDAVSSEHMQLQLALTVLHTTEQENLQLKAQLAAVSAREEGHMPESAPESISELDYLRSRLASLATEIRGLQEEAQAELKEKQNLKLQLYVAGEKLKMSEQARAALQAELVSFKKKSIQTLTQLRESVTEDLGAQQRVMERVKSFQEEATGPDVR